MKPRKALRGGMSKSYFKRYCQLLATNAHQNGSKNEPRAPRTSMGCPHEGTRVVSNTGLCTQNRMLTREERPEAATAEQQAARSRTPFRLCFCRPSWCHRAPSARVGVKVAILFTSDHSILVCACVCLFFLILYGLLIVSFRLWWFYLRIFVSVLVCVVWFGVRQREGRERRCTCACRAPLIATAHHARELGFGLLFFLPFVIFWISFFKSIFLWCDFEWVWIGWGRGEVEDAPCTDYG